jgi:hypothetical protein
VPASLAAQKFPPLFTVKVEYRPALIKAELAFVNELVRRIAEEGWGPLDLWWDIQAAAAKQHESREQEAPQEPSA